MGSSVVRYAALTMPVIKIAIIILPLSLSLLAPCQQGITGLLLSQQLAMSPHLVRRLAVLSIIMGLFQVIMLFMIGGRGRGVRRLIMCK